MKGSRLDSMGMRIGAAFALLIVAMQVAVLVEDSRSTYRAAVESEIHAARNLILMAESVRQNMERKWELGLFSPKMVREMRAPTREQLRERVLATVPVVTAWESAKAKAKEGGFEFRTPRRNARNPANNPDLLEEEVLELFAANSDLTEYHLIDEERNAVRYFRPVRLSETCMNCHGDPSRSEELWRRTDGKDVTGFLMDGKRVGDLHGAFEVIRSLEQTDATVNAVIWKGVLYTVGTIIIGTLLIWFAIDRVVQRPVHRAIARLARAERENDLTVQLENDGTAEISALAKAFNHFFGRIREFMGLVNEVSVRISEASERLGTVTEKTAQGAATQRAETEQAATAMNQMTATVQQVARTTVVAAEQAQSANDAAGKGKEEVVNTIDMIDTLAHEVGASTELIERLNGDSERIGTVIDVIRGIAEQTNLLALNAAIEAARAGEQGRGFAVVADEVRTLAGRTHDSTQEIQSMIEALQQGAQEAVASMEKGRQQVRESVLQATHAGEALDAITRAVAAITEMNAQIATSSEEQTAVATEVGRNVNNIAGVAEEGVTLNQEVAAAGQMLAQLSRQLRDTVDQFKV